MWQDFDGKAYTQEEWRARIVRLTWNKGWVPTGVTLHNTAAPNLKQWAESGPSHDARIRNLQHFYEADRGWHAGPHAFISRNFINGFSNILKMGVHSRCWNSNRIGLEMVGNFIPSDDQFNSGDGAKVRDNSVFAVAVLNLKFGFKPADLTFHRECKLDNHDCPGRLVIKPDFIELVRAKMAELSGQPVPAPPPGNAVVVPLAQPTKAFTLVDGLNVRQGASAQSFIVTTLAKSQQVTVTGHARNGDTEWSKVALSDGTEGWVASRYLANSPNHDTTWHTQITATFFGGPGDAQTGAYGGPVHGDGLEVALPFHFVGPRPAVEVRYGGKVITAAVNDVGPWNMRDPYWETGARPASETQHANKTKAQDGLVPSNTAGIDLTEGLFRALGADTDLGKIQVDWRFKP